MAATGAANQPVRGHPEMRPAHDPHRIHGPLTSARAISLVTPSFAPRVGGVEAVVGQLARHLADRGHPVHVFTHRPREGLAGYEDPPDFDVSRFSEWTRTRRFELAPGLWRDLRRREDLGVVHAHSFHGSAAILAASATDSPFVFTPHFHRVGHSKLARIAHLAYARPARRLFERANVVTCVSHAEAALVADAY